MKIFRRPQNKRFNYTPRYYKGKEKRNVYEIGSKFVNHREALNENDFGSHWKEARTNSRTRANRGVNRRLIYIILILVFIVLYLFDFDLSIFYPQS